MPFACIFRKSVHIWHLQPQLFSFETVSQIWHDNSGIREMQPWYLSYIIVHDIQTGEKFRFLADRSTIISFSGILKIYSVSSCCVLVDRWLAIDRDDLTSEVQIPVSIPDGEANAGFLFKQGIFNKLKDDHLFWSVFSRPVRSRCLAS